MKQMAKSRNSAPKPPSRELPKLIEEAQRQPGLRQVLELVEQGHQAMRPMQELSNTAPFAAGITLGSTSLFTGNRR